MDAGALLGLLRQGQPLPSAASSPAPASPQAQEAAPPSLLQLFNQPQALASSPAPPPVAPAPIASPSLAAPEAAMKKDGADVLPMASLAINVKSRSGTGVVIPPTKAGGSVQPLTIHVANGNEESLSEPCETTPITLMTFDPTTERDLIRDGSNRRRIVAWPRGVAYATRQGKIRVIDRDTGARFLLKEHAGATVLDLAVSRDVYEGVRVLAAVDSNGLVCAWAVPDSFDAPHYQRIGTFDEHIPRRRSKTVQIIPGPALLVTSTETAFTVALSQTPWALGSRTELRLPTLGEALITSVWTEDGCTLCLGRSMLYRHSTAGVERWALPDVSPATYDGIVPISSTIVAISSHGGCVVDVVDLGFASGDDVRSVRKVAEVRFVGDTDMLFGQVQLHERALLCTNSLRGSLWALDLDPIGRVARVTEYPTPEHLLSCHVIAADARLEAFAIHPKGVHQLAFRHVPYAPHALPVDIDMDLLARRRPSLADSIKVESETEVVVESAPASPSEHGDESAVGNTPAMVSTAHMASPAFADRPASPYTLAPRNDLPPIVEAPLSPRAPRPVSPRGPPSPRTAAPPPAPTPPQARDESTGSRVDPLPVLNGTHSPRSPSVRQFEDFAAAMRHELAEQERRFNEERKRDRETEAARHEQLLKLVSTTLTNNTSKALESVVGRQVEQEIIPFLGNAVMQVVSDEVDKSVARALPAELNKHVAEIASSVAAQLAPTIIAALERRTASDERLDEPWFVAALHPDKAPHFAALRNVLQRPPDVVAQLSPPVNLSLAYRLAELDDTAALPWLEASLRHLNLANDPTTRRHAPAVLQFVREHLARTAERNPAAADRFLALLALVPSF